jgi:peptidoglycan-N-acetylglucosamine deacetylase
VNRRRLLLAVGGVVLTAAGAGGYLAESHPGKARPRIRPASDVTGPDPSALADYRTAATAYSGRAGAEVVDAVTAAKDSIPVYPMNKPLYYINDGKTKAVALTIDDGPDPTYTPQVLQVLEQYKVTATFSMIGSEVASYPSLAREVAAAGHRVSNHTWSHANLQTLTAANVQSQMTKATAAIHSATGIEPVIFRAPFGNWSPAVIAQCQQMGMMPMDWSVDPRDWARPGVTSIVSNIMANTHAGSIILEHDGGGNRAQTVAALKIVIPRLLDEGFAFQIP